MIYTFTISVRGGHYYLAVLSDDKTEAVESAEEVARSFEHRSPDTTAGKPWIHFVGEHLEGTLELERGMEDRLYEHGYAHTFRATKVEPYHVRTGQRARLPGSSILR